MINFIIVDDVKEITELVKRLINEVMIKTNFEYKIHVFNDYNDKFLNLMNEEITNKIYFLDIETKSASGVDIARQIRKNDTQSIISFITAHEQLGSVIIKESLMVLTFISKFDDFENRIKDTVLKSIDIIKGKQVLKFNEYNTIYIVPIDEILYITRDTVDRKCIIKTVNCEYKVYKTLNELDEMTNHCLTQTHRACFVNEKRVIKIDKKEKIITFDTGDTINLISTAHRKEIIK